MKNYRFDRVQKHNLQSAMAVMQYINGEIAIRHKDKGMLIDINVVGPDEHDKDFEVYLTFRYEVSAA